MQPTHVLGPDWGAGKLGEFDFGHLPVFLKPVVVVGGTLSRGQRRGSMV